MNWIPNQPVYFGEAYDCTDDEIPNQLVHNTDVSQVQFSMQPCEGATQLMPDPNFADTGSWGESEGWTIEDGMLCCSGENNTGVVSTYQLNEDNYYQVNLTVYSISPGASFRVSFGFEIVGYITSVGTYTFYGFPTPFFGSTGIIIFPEVSGSTICFSEVTAYEVLTDVIIAVYDVQDNYVAEISYANNPENFTISKDTITATIDWSTLEAINGCYYLCLLDPCENTNGQNYPPVILNPEFAIYVGDGSTPNWTLEDDWTNNPPMTGFYFLGGSLYQENVFPTLTSNYCVSVSFQNLIGSVNVLFGDTVVGVIEAGDASPITITGMPTTNGNLSFVLNADTYVELISVNACTIDPSDYTCNSRSNIFKVADYNDKCTLVLHACNNEDGLGFVFEGSGFIPRIRLEAKLRQAKYANERNTYTNSVGKKSVYYFDGRKQKNLCIDQQPEYVHDFLRLFLGFDNVYIQNLPYVVDDDEYNVEYAEVNDVVGKVRLLVSERTQNVKNTNCSGTENQCSLEDFYMLRADDPASFVTQTDGGKIKIK